MLEEAVDGHPRAVDRRDRRPPRRLLRGRERPALRPAAGDVPVIVSGFGPEAAELAGRIGDGYWGTAPDAELHRRRSSKAGGTGPALRAAQPVLGRGRGDGAQDGARDLAERRRARASSSQDLPTWTHFEQAAELVTEEQATKSVPCGPDIADDRRRGAPVRRRRLRPPLLPPDRPRPGGLLPLLGRRAPAPARRRRRACRSSRNS